jgi:hypothetical protein
VSTVTLAKRVRRIIGDEGETFAAQVMGDGVNSRYELPVENIDPEQLSVQYYGSSTALNPGHDYVIDYRYGVLTFTTPIPLNQTVTVTGTAYREFVPSDIDVYVRTAFIQHTHNRNPPLVLDAPNPDAETPPALVLPEVEEKPVAIAAAIEALWDMATDASQDIDITTPDGVQISRQQRYQQIMQIIAVEQQRYQEICEQLNVGLRRIEMFDLRRVSRTTNRLVPLYVAREMDDRTFPLRKLPAIDLGADRVINYRGLYSPTTQYFVNDMVDEGGVVPAQLSTTTTAQVNLAFGGGITVPVVGTGVFFNSGIIAMMTIANGVQQVSYAYKNPTAFLNVSQGFGIVATGTPVIQMVGASSQRFICVAQPPIGTDPTADVLTGTQQPNGSQAGHYWVTSTLNSAWQGQW